MTTTEIHDPGAGFDPAAGLVPRTVELAAGALVVLEAGAGGRPLLLVHGFTGSKEDFGAEVLRLADLGFHVVAPDHRGHGGSHRPAEESEYRFESFAEDMFALADALGWSTFDLLGHSMGGMIAQHMVLARPERISRLVLMDTSHGPVQELDAELVDLGIELARAQGLAPILEVMKLGADPLANPAHAKLCDEIPGYQAWCDAKFLASSAAMFASMLRRFGEAPDRLDALRAVHCPTLVIVGELDAPFLPDSERMAEAISGARLAVVPGAGHSPQLEATDAWRRALDDFLLAPT